MEEHRQPSDAGASTGPAQAAAERTGVMARLSAALHQHEAQSCRLAIDALAEEVTRLSPGGLYVVYAMPRTPGCDALIWETAREACTRHVTIVLSRTRTETAARMRELGFVPGLPVRGWPRNLNVLAMRPAAAYGRQPQAAEEGAIRDAVQDPMQNAAQPAAFPASAPAFARLIGGLRALKRFGFRAGALYLIEGAERWFSWTDAETLAREGRLLADWCAAHKVALVLLVHPTPATPIDDDDAIAREDQVDDEASHSGRSEFHGACAGVARMRRTHGELLWHADFWRFGRALVTGEVHALRFTEQGHLTVAHETSSPGPRAHTGALLAQDEERVVATRKIVANETWVPDEWEIVDDIDAAVAACRDAVAATVLLDYAESASLEPLCAAVHALRRHCGRALKIVVVERGQALRHQYELLLLSLGANLLLGRDLPFSRMQSLLRSLYGQVDTRPFMSDYRASLAAALTDAVRGYLPVNEFCQRVQVVLQRGEQLQLPYVMAKLALLPQVSHVDALKSCQPRRAGDVFTVDAAHLYVFLFACRLPDADAALTRIFDAPVERWSDNIVFLAGDSIAKEAASLADANRRTPMADYRDLFPDAVTAPALEHVLHHEQPDGSDAPPPKVPEAVTQVAAQLRALERMLAKASGELNGSGAAQQPARRRRLAEPCAIPLRAIEEK